MFCFNIFFIEFKEDINEAKARMNACWDHKIIDRPVLSYNFPKRRGKLGAYLDNVDKSWFLAQNCERIDKALNRFEFLKESKRDTK